LKKQIIILLISLLLLFIYDDIPLLVFNVKNNKISDDSKKNSQLHLFKNSICAEPSGKPVPDNSKEAYNNYITLRKLYFKWNKGLLKSKRHYKRVITKHLISIIGKEILTDYDYALISPEGRYEKELSCNLLLGRWLQVKGDIQQETLIKIVEKKPELLTKWWRSKKLLSVSGRLKDFSLDSDPLGEVIIIHLKDIKVKESDNDSTGKNNK
jgi:hypothetical protein